MKKANISCFYNIPVTLHWRSVRATVCRERDSGTLLYQWCAWIFSKLLSSRPHFLTFPKNPIPSINYDQRVLFTTVHRNQLPLFHVQHALNFEEWKGMGLEFQSFHPLVRSSSEKVEWESNSNYQLNQRFPLDLIIYRSLCHLKTKNYLILFIFFFRKILAIHFYRISGKDLEIQNHRTGGTMASQLVSTPIMKGPNLS